MLKRQSAHGIVFRNIPLAHEVASRLWSAARRPSRSVSSDPQFQALPAEGRNNGHFHLQSNPRTAQLYKQTLSSNLSNYVNYMEPSKDQPWYGHWMSPFSWIRPSESRAAPVQDCTWRSQKRQSQTRANELLRILAKHIYPNMLQTRQHIGPNPLKTLRMRGLAIL